MTAAMTDEEIQALWAGARAELSAHQLELFAIRARAMADAGNVQKWLEENDNG